MAARSLSIVLSLRWSVITPLRSLPSSSVDSSSLAFSWIQLCRKKNWTKIRSLNICKAHSKGKDQYNYYFPVNVKRKTAIIYAFCVLLLLLRSSCSCLSDSETRCHNVVHCQGKFFRCAVEFLLCSTKGCLRIRFLKQCFKRFIQFPRICFFILCFSFD